MKEIEKKIMKIDISDFNREILKQIVIEETERDEIFRKLYQDAVDYKLVSEDVMPEYKETLKIFDRKRKYLEQLIEVLPNLDQIELSNEEEIDYFRTLIESQIEISRSRIEDFQPGQRIYESLAARSEDKKDYVEGVERIIQYEQDCIQCCNDLRALIPESENTKES